MFTRRLKWFSGMISALALLILIRLVDVQVVRAGAYEELADRLMTRPVLYLPAPRGAIRDREGRLLLSDAPTSDIGVHYLLLERFVSGDEAAPLLIDRPDRGPRDRPSPYESYLFAVARELRKTGQYEDGTLRDAVRRIHAEVAELWPRLAGLTGRPLDELHTSAERICAQVRAVKRAVQRRSPTVHTIAEETTLHALVADIGDSDSIAIRLELERPWLRVIPSSRRQAHQADTLVHVLGRLGQASAERIEQDPLRGDEFEGLAAGDLCGVSGVERVAELALRGTRGRIIESIDRVIEERIDPRPGGDVLLSIDRELQDEIYGCLAEAVAAAEEEHPSAGAAAVVIDARTREVLAAVSYPTYRYDEFNENYAALRDDARWVPLRSHAFQNVYPPGSTCKIAALYGALADGVVSPGTSISCNGYYLEHLQTAFRCWLYNQHRATHGPQTASDAIRNSCNIFFYTCGEKLGAERLGHWFRQLGLGRTTGTGLIEEAAGIVPSNEWMARYRPREPELQVSDAWNFSIGQGEISATPLQCANAAASVAVGRWAPVRLVRTADGTWLAPQDVAAAHDLDPGALRTVREGMYRVVNERGATAFRARLESVDHVLCGKTGSAQAVPRPISRRWTIEWPDGRREDRIGPTDRNAFLATIDADERPKIAGYRTYERFPPVAEGAKLPSHAWFIGYTQHRSTAPGEPARGSVYAIAVLVEYAGSGGQTASPVAKRIAEYLLNKQRAWGSAAGPPGGRGVPVR